VHSTITRPQTLLCVQDGLDIWRAAANVKVKERQDRYGRYYYRGMPDDEHKLAAGEASRMVRVVVVAGVVEPYLANIIIHRFVMSTNFQARRVGGSPNDFERGRRAAGSGPQTRKSPAAGSFAPLTSSAVAARIAAADSRNSEFASSIALSASR